LRQIGNVEDRSMNLFRHPGIVLIVLGAACAPAFAQMTDAQRSAIKSACRSDYMTVCASVPTGTQASLQCLQQHATQVSSGCQSALAAVAPAPTATATAPSAIPGTTTAAPAASAEATAPAAAAAPAAASQMSQADKGRLLRRDCGSDFEKFCSGVGLGGGRGTACLKAHASDLSASCKAALMSMAPAH
jgi:hypothetical protein